MKALEIAEKVGYSDANISAFRSVKMSVFPQKSTEITVPKGFSGKGAVVNLKRKVRTLFEALYTVLLDTMRVKSIQFTITMSFILITVTVMLIVSLVLYNKFARTAEESAFLNTSNT